MTISNQRKLANHIFRLLKTNELIFPICRTSRGNLGLRFTPNNDDYEMYLDAVPLTTTDVLRDDNNIELKKMLEKYLFEDSIKGIITLPQLKETYIAVTQSAPPNEQKANKEVKKRGRPSKKK